MLAEEFLYSIGCSLAAVGVAYGILKTRVQEIEKRQEILETEQRNNPKDYVTHKHLDAVLPPMRGMIEEIQRDIKKLLLLISHAEEDDRDFD